MITAAAIRVARRALFIANAAAELLGDRNWRFFAGEHGVNRVFQAVLLHGAFIHVVINRARVHDLAVAIEQERVRGAGGAVLTGAVLRRIGDVGVRKTLLLS